MKSAYIAISYKCNQRCSFCPCSKEEKTTFPYLSMDEITTAVDEFISEKQIDTIVVSGGEPTIHPQFFEIMHYLTVEKSLHTVILSNGESYAKDGFIERLARSARIEKITAITTIHSQYAEQHEGINGSKGSFERSIKGMLNMYYAGAEVIVKHCITRENYKDLEGFYNFIDERFPKEVSVQLCSIDYCGMNKITDDDMLSFPVLRPYLEKMFDAYIDSIEDDNPRHLYAINMPFCSCDPYYWILLTQRSNTYDSYASPDKDGGAVKLKKVENNVGTFAPACRDCAAVSICPGTYKTAFEYFGNKIVEPY